jgi:hypothetical protein
LSRHVIPGTTFESAKRHDIYGWSIRWAAVLHLPAISLQLVESDDETSPALLRRQLTPSNRAPDRLFVHTKKLGSIARGDNGGRR